MTVPEKVEEVGEGVKISSVRTGFLESFRERTRRSLRRYVRSMRVSNLLKIQISFFFFF